jgi:predicted amidohydrolase
MRITLAQVDSTADVERNLRQIRRAVARASVDGPSLVVFPEYAMYEKKVVDASFAAVAQPLDGEFGLALSDLARQHAVALAVGVVECNPLDPLRPFNTIAVFGPDGSLRGRHRKTHLYDEGVFHESAWISAPDDPHASVIDVAGRRLGLMTCNDLRFPELGTQLAAHGADLVAVCASWVPGPHKTEQWRVLAQARAVENGYPVVAVSQAEPISIGNSLIATPDGVVLTRLGGASEERTVALPERRQAASV